MHGAKGPETNIIFDLTNPNREMFTRNGEVPNFGIIATHPMYSEIVGLARAKVLNSLHILMGEPDEGIVVMQQEVIEMEGGDNMTLSSDSLVLSLLYDKGEPKLICLELSEPNQVTIH